jgi:uncharacterized membrane protein
MKKNEQRRMRVESEIIRDVNRQDICEMVRNNREAVRRLLRRIWVKLVNNVTRASLWYRISIISERFAFGLIQDV